MEAYGLSPKDLRSQERLGAGEWAGALKDRKIDAFIWDGGLPTAAVLDLAATPGIKIRLISHGDAVSKMVAKYGPLYFIGTIPKGTYAGVESNIPVAAATNLWSFMKRWKSRLPLRSCVHRGEAPGRVAFSSLSEPFPPKA
jgi:TRAP transporter TAXI family solute receptor